jgi:hypothetical protein
MGMHSVSVKGLRLKAFKGLKGLKGFKSLSTSLVDLSDNM